MNIDLQNLQRIAHIKIQQLKNELSNYQLLIGDFEIFIVGAVKTGLYFGPKKKFLSLNINCPFDEVIEVDIRFILPENKNPHDDKIIRVIKCALMSEYAPIKKESYHWSELVPITYLYHYEKINNNLGFEWELCINRQPYVDIANYWDKIFSKKEIIWQRLLRKKIQTLQLSPVHEYIPFKNKQTTEGRWRLIASNALGVLNFPAPIKGISKEPINYLVKQWLAGARGMRTMERPISFVSKEIYRKLLETHSVEEITKLVSPPNPPLWVNIAQRVQNELQQKLRN